VDGGQRGAPGRRRVNRARSRPSLITAVEASALTKRLLSFSRKAVHEVEVIDPRRSLGELAELVPRARSAAGPLSQSVFPARVVGRAYRNAGDSSADTILKLTPRYYGRTIPLRPVAFLRLE
jgi:hypothetical protein